MKEWSDWMLRWAADVLYCKYIIWNSKGCFPDEIKVLLIRTHDIKEYYIFYVRVEIREFNDSEL